MNIPTTTVQELGSDKQVGKIFDLPEVSVTVSAIDVGARTAFVLAGRNDWATVASGTYVEAQDITYACLVETFKSQTTDDIARSLYIPGAKVDRISLNYSVNGDATEEYTFGATDRRWLKYDVAIASGVVSASGTLAFSPAARLLKNGNYYLSAFASGIGYLTSDAVTSSDSAGITFDTTQVAASTPVVVTYHTDLTNQWDYTYEYANVAPGSGPPDQPVGVRGWGVEVYLVKSGQSNQKVYRGQTVTIQAQFPQTRVNELGNEQAVGYTQGIPEVTGTLEILHHDFQLIELLSGDTVGSADNWEPDDLGSGDWGLEVRIWRRNANRTTTQPEKTVLISKLDITQENNGAQVGQDSRVTFNFSSRDGKVYFIKGSRTTGFFGE